MDVVIEPKELRTGVSIAATFYNLPPDTSTLEIIPMNRALSPFQIPLKNLRGIQKLAEFTILSPGEYVMRSGTFNRGFKVSPQVDLSFQKEFGISVILILITFMGTIVWGTRFKRRTTK